MRVSIEKVMARILSEAEKLELDAGFGGRHNDASASILRTQVEFYKHGKSGSLPPQWRKAEQDVAFQEDPEWDEYKRLAKKFEQIL